MDLETYLRVHLDTKNHAGRALAEHRLTVSEPAPGFLVIRVYPDGFNSYERMFCVVGNSIGEAGPETIEKVRADARAAEIEAERARDLQLQAAEIQRQAEEGAAELKRRQAEAAEAAKLAPPDLATALPDGDQRA